MQLVSDQGLPLPLGLFYIGLQDGHHANAAYDILYPMLCAAAEAQGFVKANPKVDLDTDDGFQEFQKGHPEFAEMLLEAQAQSVEEGIAPFAISSIFKQGLGFDKAEDVPPIEVLAQRAGDALRVAIPLTSPPSHLGLATVFWHGLQADFVQTETVTHILSILSEQLQNQQELFAPVADSLLGGGMIWEVLEEDEDELPVSLADFIEFFWPMEDGDFSAEDAMSSEVEKVASPGIEREDGWLYFLTEEGDVARQRKHGGDIEIIAETQIERESGYMYYLDASGDVARVPFMVPFTDEF